MCALGVAGEQAHLLSLWSRARRIAARIPLSASSPAGWVWPCAAGHLDGLASLAQGAALLRVCKLQRAPWECRAWSVQKGRPCQARLGALSRQPVLAAVPLCAGCSAAWPAAWPAYGGPPAGPQGTALQPGGPEPSAGAGGRPSQKPRYEATSWQSQSGHTADCAQRAARFRQQQGQHAVCSCRLAIGSWRAMAADGLSAGLAELRLTDQGPSKSAPTGEASVQPVKASARRPERAGPGPGAQSSRQAAGVAGLQAAQHQLRQLIGGPC